MDLVTVSARDLPEAWWKSLRATLTQGRIYPVEKGSFEGQRRLEIAISLEIANPGSRPLAPSVPDGVPAPTNEDYIERYLYFLADPDKQPNEHYTYGEDLSPQVAEVLARFPDWGPNTNRYTMMCGGRDSLFNYRAENQVSSAHSPCLRVVDIRIEDNQLHFFCYFRSWDLFAGFPTNLGGLQLLKEQMGQYMELEDGKLFAFSKGLHLYEHAWKWALDSCAIKMEDSALFGMIHVKLEQSK